MFLTFTKLFPILRTPTEDDRKLFDQQKDEYKQGKSRFEHILLVNYTGIVILRYPFHKA